MRDAANASLVQAALSAIGVDVEIIAGEREARLSFMGTLSGFADTAFADKTVISVDVGGGSTELVVGDTQAIRKLHSFDIGSRRVTERFLQSDPPTSAEIDKARQWIQAELAPFFSDLLELGYQPQVLLAVAGTATTALTVSQAIEPYDPTKVHGATMDVGELQIVIDRLATLPLQQRRAVVGLEPARASVVIGGLLVLDEVLGAAGLGSFTVSETDILHGILLDAYHSQAV
jgi:exopolyphosphatase/guanosine-5'-triphosphate,3'-diphosphate pyrophosphatase